LQTDINKFTQFREGRILNLAEKHHKKAGHIQQLLINEPSFKSTCKPSLQNALIHYKTVQVNEGMHYCKLFITLLTTTSLGRSAGDHLTLSVMTMLAV
jgi:hypothetical protein